MTKPLISGFDALAPLLIQKYERFLPTAFDESMSLLQKVNKVIVYLNQIGELTNNVVDQWNEVMEWIEQEGFSDLVSAKLEGWALDGTLESIINEEIFNDKADKTYVDTQLGLKANATDLALKEDKTVVALKSNKTTLPYVHVEDAGILPDGTDVYTSLQAFITANKGKRIQLGQGTYTISKPILLPIGTELVGVQGIWNDVTGTVLKRTTNNVEAKYSIDAVLILDYEPSENYHRNSKVKHINLDGFGDSSRNAYGIYAKSSAYIELRDVHIRYVDQGFYTENTWQSILNVSVRYARKGIVFASPSQISTGTSIIFEKCFMSYISDKAYDIYGLNYSTMISCAGDFIDGSVYVFNRCKGIVMNGCGTEYSADVFDNWASTVTVNGLNVLHPKGKTPSSASAYLKTRTAPAKTTFVTCDLGALETPGDSYNIICDGGGVMVFVNTDKPTGGNTFISYSGGSKIVEIGSAGLVVSPA
jgi:hypothetical protein